MKRLSQNILAATLCATAVSFLSGCDNDNNNSSTTTPTTPTPSTDTVKGTAATGKAFVGKVVVKNKNGVESTPVTIGADGKFSVSIEKAPPYIIKVYNEGETLYSFAPAATDNVNVTQLTTQAIFAVNTDPENRDYNSLADAYTAWKTIAAGSTAEELQTAFSDAAKEAVANLKTLFDANGYGGDKGYPDLFKTSFTVGAAGLDKVLDGVIISGLNQACTGTGSTYTCSVRYKVGESTNYEWNYSISTAGISIKLNPGTGGTGGTGNYNLKVITTVAGVATEISIPNVPKPDTQTAFCDAADIKQQLPPGFVINSCSFSGNTGTIAATVTASGFSLSYSVKYQYTPA